MKNKEKLLEQERAFDAKIKNAGKVFTCNDSKLTERMMRCGIEARVFCPDNEDELRHIALVTLKMDAVNSLPSNMEFVSPCAWHRTPEQIQAMHERDQEMASAARQPMQKRGL